MKTPIKILQLVINEPKDSFYQKQLFFILNRMPDFKYRRDGSYLVAEDGPFRNCYGLSCGVGSGAFANRKFEIPLEDGGVEIAEGQWWDCVHPSWKDEEVVSAAYKTIPQLRECYVFYGGTANKKFVDDFLATNPKPFIYQDHHTQLGQEKRWRAQFKKLMLAKYSFSESELELDEKDQYQSLTSQLDDLWNGFYEGKKLSQLVIDNHTQATQIFSRAISQIESMPSSQEDLEVKIEEGEDLPESYDEIDFKSEYERCIDIAVRANREYWKVVKSEYTFDREVLHEPN